MDITDYPKNPYIVARDVRYERGITQLLDILIKTFDLSTSVEDYRGKLFAIYLMEGERFLL